MVNRRLAGSALLVSLVLIADLTRPPERQWSAAALLAGIHLYQRTLSPWVETAGVRCRFRPSCSRYAEAAIRQDGAFVGLLRGAVRIARCGPWTAAGTVDPP